MRGHKLSVYRLRIFMQNVKDEEEEKKQIVNLQKS
jgi:hypothetical protein